LKIEEYKKSDFFHRGVIEKWEKIFLSMLANRFFSAYRKKKSFQV